MSDQIYQRVESEMDPLTKIIKKVPGFSGYLERGARRASDKMLRDVIATQTEQQWQRVSSLQRDFINRGEIALVDDLEGAGIKVRTFTDRVRRASRGYAGLFDAIKIQEEELEQIYQYDAGMLFQVDELSHAIDNVETSIGSDGLPASIRHLTSVAQQLIDLFDRREQVILGIGKE